MNLSLDAIQLRKPEPKDAEALYRMKNDPAITRGLGGFSSGYSMADMAAWVDFHRKAAGECLWIIAAAESDAALGHVGLYNIDHRVASAEYAILLGDRSTWGRGLGRQITHTVLAYAFDELALNRIELKVLSSNVRAIALYKRVGFHLEGTLREAQFRQGSFVDVHVMSILKGEFAR